MLNLNNKKILIIRFSSLGDILLTTPILRSLKKLYPTCNIDYLVKAENKETILYNPYINDILLFNKTDNLNQLKETIKSKNYDYIFDLHNNLRSKVLTKGLKAYCIKKPTLKKFLLVKFKINLLKENKSVVNIYADAIPGLKLDKSGIDLFLDSKKLVIPDLNTVGICPGARHFTKRWGFDNYKELINLLTKEGYKVLLFGGEYDQEMCGKLAGDNTLVENLSTCNELITMGNNMRRCQLIIGNDSGLMHAATGLQIPVIVIFTSTVKELGFAPYNAKSMIIENNDIKCRPCSHIGRGDCPKKHFNCGNTIKPKMVFNKLQEFYNTL